MNPMKKWWVSIYFSYVTVDQRVPPWRAKFDGFRVSTFSATWLQPWEILCEKAGASESLKMGETSSTTHQMELSQNPNSQPPVIIKFKIGIFFPFEIPTSDQFWGFAPWGSRWTPPSSCRHIVTPRKTAICRTSKPSPPCDLGRRVDPMGRLSNGSGYIWI